MTNAPLVYFFGWGGGRGGGGLTEEMKNGMQWKLSRMVTVLCSHSLNQTASLDTSRTKTLQSTSVEQPPLYKGQLELAYRWLL